MIIVVFSFEKRPGSCFSTAFFFIINFLFTSRGYEIAVDPKGSGPTNFGTLKDGLDFIDKGQDLGNKHTIFLSSTSNHYINESISQVASGSFDELEIKAREQRASLFFGDSFFRRTGGSLSMINIDIHIKKGQIGPILILESILNLNLINCSVSSLGEAVGAIIKAYSKFGIARIENNLVYAINFNVSEQSVIHLRSFEKIIFINLLARNITADKFQHNFIDIREASRLDIAGLDLDEARFELCGPNSSLIQVDSGPVNLAISLNNTSVKNAQLNAFLRMEPGKYSLLGNSLSFLASSFQSNVLDASVEGVYSINFSALALKKIIIGGFLRLACKLGNACLLSVANSSFDECFSTTDFFIVVAPREIAMDNCIFIRARPVQSSLATILRVYGRSKIRISSVTVENCSSFNGDLFLNVIKHPKSDGDINFAANSSVTFFSCKFLFNEIQADEASLIRIGKEMNTAVSVGDCEFRGNLGYLSAQDGLAITVGALNDLFITTTNFTNSSGGGGSLSLFFEGRDLLILKCQFVNSSESAQNSAKGIEFAGRLLWIQECLFSFNSALEGPVIKVPSYSTQYTKTINISNCKFINNTSTLSAFQLLESNGLKMHMQNCLIENNTGFNRGGFLRLYYYGLGQFNLSFINCTFNHNSATLGGAIHFGNTKGSINLTACSFEANKAQIAGGALSVNTERSVHLKMANCLFKRNFAAMFGASVSLLLGYFQDKNSSFIESNSRQGADIFSGSYSWLELNNTFFSRTYTSKGKALFLLASTWNYLSKVIFSECETSGSGAAIGVYKYAEVVLDGVKFISNRAPSGTLIYSSFSRFQIQLIDCEAYLNFASTLALVHINTANVLIKNLKCGDNFGQVLHLSNSNLSATEMTITNNKCLPALIACFLESLQKSSVLLSDIKISNMEYKGSSGIIYLKASALNIHDSQISTNSSLNKGVAFIYVEAGSVFAFTVWNSGYKDKAVVCKNSNFTAENCEFSAYGGVDLSAAQAFYSVESILVIKSCSFSQHQTSALIIKGHASNCNTMLIGSSFMGNMNEEGGALQVKGCNITIDSSSFKNNYASKRGGAIFLECLEINCRWALRSNTFLFNKASGGGGGLFWRDIAPNLSSNNFSQNTASYGKDFASFAVKIAVNISQGEIERLQKLISGEKLNFSLRFTLLDYYNQIVSVIGSGKGRILINSTASLPSGEEFSYKGSNNSHYSILGLSTSETIAGQFEFSDLKFISLPTSKRRLLIYHDDIPSAYPKLFSTEDGGFILTSDMKYFVFLDVAFVECQKGQVFLPEKNVCESCTEGTYVFESGASWCNPCLAHSKCPGGDVILLDKGYWRQDALATNVYKCINEFSCRGGPNASACNRGFMGMLCDSCVIEGDEIFFKDLNKMCRSCNSDEKNRALALMILAIVLMFSYIIYVIKKKMRNSLTLSSVLLKVLTDYLQVSGIITAIDVEWPFELKDLFQVQGTVNNPDNMMIALDCGLRDFIPGMNIYFKKVILNALFCLFLPSAILVFWLIYGFVKKIEKASLRAKIITSFVIAFFTYQPSFINQFFGTMLCTKIEDKLYLTKTLLMECWTKEHLFIIYVIVIPGLSLLMIIVPANFLKGMRDKTVRASSSSPFSFLSNGYRNSLYFWDFVLMGHKYLLIIITVFLIDKGLILFLLLIISVAFLSLQVLFVPYKFHSLNRMALLSRLSTHLTVVVYTLSVLNISKTVISIFFAVFLLSHTCFLIWWLIFFLSLNKEFMSLFHRIFYFLPGDKYYRDNITGEKTSISPGRTYKISSNSRSRKETPLGLSSPGGNNFKGAREVQPVTLKISLKPQRIKKSDLKVNWNS